VDVLNRIRGVNLADIIKRAIKVKVADTTLKVAHIDDLIKMKKLAGRPQDKADIAKLLEYSGKRK
jgi:predicted nucleotidyltransferase